MGMREQAEADLSFILEDKDGGFGWDITVTDPSETAASLVGFSDDIAQVIDPDTGVAVSGRLASVSIRISTLTEKGLSLPVGIADAGSKPWLIAFNDINGNPYIFKVSQSNPDRALGVVTCLLEVYQ
jgi:hypothetical protein